MAYKYIYVVHYYDTYEIDAFESAESAINAGRDEVEAKAQNYERYAEPFKAEEIRKEFTESVDEYGAEYSVEDVVWCEKIRVFP